MGTSICHGVTRGGDFQGSRQEEALLVRPGWQHSGSWCVAGCSSPCAVLFWGAGTVGSRLVVDGDPGPLWGLAAVHGMLC